MNLNQNYTTIKNFYITSQIYYPNKLMPDNYFFADSKEWMVLMFFLTVTDEHGLKIQRAAEKNLETLKFCDELTKTFKELSKILNLSNLIL